jgi:hypothetical protein
MGVHLCPVLSADDSVSKSPLLVKKGAATTVEVGRCRGRGPST